MADKITDKKTSKSSLKTNPKANEKAKASAEGTSSGKVLSRQLSKKVSKSLSASRKQAAKSKVRMTRATLRAAKAAEASGEKAGKGSRSKLKASIGQAPHSSRISAPKGPIQNVSSKTQFVPKENDLRKWLLVDASGQTVGRLASEIAMLLRGKHKPQFTPNSDAGDFVVVINSDKVRFSSTKDQKKTYYWHSGYISGLKERSPEDFRNRGQSDKIIFKAVRGMITRSPLGRALMTKLKIYNDDKHPHAAQRPVVWNLTYSSARG